MSSEPTTPPPDEDPKAEPADATPPPPPFDPDPRLIGYLEREQKGASNER
jgi:hypothetical protein